MANVAAVRVLPVSVTMSDAFSARTVPAFDVPVAAVPAVAVDTVLRLECKGVSSIY